MSDTPRRDRQLGLPLDAEADFELYVNGPRYAGKHRRD